MMKFYDENVLVIKNINVNLEKILRQLYFAENTETGQGVITRDDFMKCYEKATKKEKKILIKIPFHHWDYLIII